MKHINAVSVECTVVEC